MMTPKQAIKWICHKREDYRKGLLSSHQIHKCEQITGWKWGGCYGTKLLKEHPLYDEVHPILNKDIDISNLSLGTNKKIWWLGKCGHEWDARIPDRAIKGSGCPYCGGRKADRTNCLATTHSKIAKEWHPTKNAKLTGRDVVAGSHKKVWWLGKCGHEWNAMIKSRTTRGNGCPYCSGHRICKDNCLSTTHPKIAKEWHPTKNGTLTAKNVVAGSHKKVWWFGKCGHEWDATIEHRTNGRGCPFCSGKRVDKINCLSTKYPNVAKMLHPTKNGNVTGKDITGGSGKKVWFITPRGKERYTNPVSMVKLYGNK